MVPIISLVAVKVEDCPAHIVGGNADAEITGNGFTVSVIVAQAEQPAGVEPQTV